MIPKKIILLFFLLLIATTAQAYQGTINQIVNNTNYINITFITNTPQNQTFYISVPLNTTFTNLTIQIRGHPGINITSETQQLVNESNSDYQEATGTYETINLSVTHINMTNFADKDWNTYGYYSGGTNGYLIEEINLTTTKKAYINTIQFKTRYQNTNQTYDIPRTCIDYLRTTIDIESYYSATPSKYIKACGTTLYTAAGTFENFYEMEFYINYTKYPTNITTYIANQQQYNYTRILNTSFTITLNNTYINQQITQCNCPNCQKTETNCTIPIQVTSDTTGTMEITILTANYDITQLINFDTNTSGYVTWQNRNTLTTDGFQFQNVNTINLTNLTSQNELINVIFNNQQQLLQYNLTPTWSGYDNIHVETPDVSQTIKIWDGTQTLQGLVTAYKLVNQTLWKTYQVYTDKAGEANLQLTGANTYK